MLKHSIIIMRWGIFFRFYFFFRVPLRTIRHIVNIELQTQFDWRTTTEEKEEKKTHSLTHIEAEHCRNTVDFFFSLFFFILDLCFFDSNEMLFGRLAKKSVSMHKRR